MQEFYRQLLEVLRLPALRHGDWRLLECTAAGADDPTVDGFIAFSWELGPEARGLVVVNYAARKGCCRVHLPFPDLAGHRTRFEGRLGSASYEREGDALLAEGLTVELPAWGYHVFELVPEEAESDGSADDGSSGAQNDAPNSRA